MTPNILLFFLPAIAYAVNTITVNCKPGMDPSMEFEGKIVETIRYYNGEKFVWNINDDKLKYAIIQLTHNGLLPEPEPRYDNNKTQTPWEDRNMTYQWMQCATLVRRTFYPVSGECTLDEKEPVKTQRRFISPSDDVINKFVISSNKTKIVRAVVTRNLIGSGAKLVVGPSINYNVNAKFHEPVPADDFPFSLSFSHPWGKRVETQKNSTEVLLTPTSTIVDAQNVNANIVTRTKTRTIYGKVTYRATLDGAVTCNFDNKYFERKFYSYDINRLLKYNNRSVEIITNEEFKVVWTSKEDVVSLDL